MEAWDERWLCLWEEDEELVKEKNELHWIQEVNEPDITVCVHVFYSGAAKWHNRSVGDTSMKIGMNSLHGSLDKKTFQATWNFKMVAISKMAAA